MILTKYLCKLHPFISAIVPQTRNLRSNIKIGKDKFQLSVDVHKFNKDELRVKARPDCLVIEGKQERKTKTGYVMRRFTRKFRLPPGCSPKKIESKLSPEGILTITAPRKNWETTTPCETLIPIGYSDPQKNDKEKINIKSTNSCEDYLNNKDNKK
uniref:SHSP domain-containing protein n=1 Tax=Bombyx mori TaxID=7091 RepID=A0A8R2R517_BOMMO|nr:heat shock protein beta-1 [Bombyx mori]XP_037877363.1 heat shock protein beta-1-like [Bombyx mori]